MPDFDYAHVAPPLDRGAPVRESVSAVQRALGASGEDPSECPDQVIAALKPLIPLREDLYATAQVRPSKNPGHMMSTIYYDPSMMLQIVGAPGGFRLPAHCHSAWNVLFICEGRMDFTWYRRLDDRSVPGRAELKVADDRILGAGDAGMVARPPDDIHELEVISDYLWMLVVTPEPEVSVREIYSPLEGTYEIKALAPVPPLHAGV